MDVLRVGGIRPCWASEARVELVPTPESGRLAYRGGAHRVGQGKQTNLFVYDQTRLLRRGTRILLFRRGNFSFRRYKREFPTEHEAQEFARDLKGKPVAAHCNSTIPSSSALLEPGIDLPLQNRAPARLLTLARPQTPFQTGSDRSSGSSFSFSGIALVVSLWVHLGAVNAA
jgi:hypothetical protein